MRFQARELRAIGLLVLAVVAFVAVIVYRALTGTPEVVGSAETPAVLERRLAKLRQSGATVPAKTVAYQALETQLKTREKHILAFNTVPQAEAHLLEVIRRVASANKIEARGGDFAPPTPLGSDYGEVAVAVVFECHIEDFVNFLADLSKEPELIAPAEVHVIAGNSKNKSINVRMTLAGVVAKSLVPAKKAFGVL